MKTFFRRITPALVATFLTTFLAGGTLHAQAAGANEDTQADEDVAWSERIVVTATRSDQTAAQVPLHALVVDKDEIDADPGDGIADLLRTVPSFNWQGDSTIITSTPLDGGITFRGLGGQARGRALMMVDGMPVNEPFGTWVVMSRLPRGTVERVEILPGGTGIWGNFSMTGTVNLITRSPSANSFSGNLRAGNKSTVMGTLGYSDRGERWSGSLFGDALDTDGHFKVAPENLGPIAVPISKDVVLVNGNVHRTLGDRGLVRVTGTFFEEEAIDTTPLSVIRSEEDAFTAQLDWGLANASRWDLRVYARQTVFFEQEPNVTDGFTAEALDSITDVPADALGLGAFWSSSGAGNHSIKIGGDLQEVEIDADVFQNFDGSMFEDYGSIQGTQRFAGLFVQDVFTPSDRTSLTLGGRFDVLRVQDGFRRQFDLTTGSFVDTVLVDEVTNEVFTPSLGLVHQLSDSARLRASIYGGFRTGAPGEMFVDNLGRNVNKSNPQLEPEEMLGAEIGIDFSPGRISSTRATFYVHETENMIDRLNVGRAGSQPEIIEPCGLLQPGGRCRFRQNLDTVRVAGLELDQRFDLSDFWQVWLSATAIDSEVRESLIDPELVGNSVRKTPDEVATLRINYRNPKVLFAELRTRYVSERFDDVENQDVLESQFYVDLSLSRDLGPNWRLFASVSNLLDEDYIVNFTGDGDEISAPRLYRVGVRFRLD